LKNNNAIIIFFVRAVSDVNSEWVEAMKKQLTAIIERRGGYVSLFQNLISPANETIEEAWRIREALDYSLRLLS
jgi:hypothetical protein